MSKNIVICCDGTDNMLTVGKNTNVIHLYSCLVQDQNQVAYYNPGVGTIAPDNYRNKINRAWYKVKDLATAASLEENVLDAYRFLMNEYEEEANVYLFGFSRGAYTIRMLSGLIEMFGLLQKGNDRHLRHVMKAYSQSSEKFETANKFKKRFSRAVNIRFMGIWDTVISVGGPIKYYLPFPFSDKLSIVKTLRHAVGIDERRKHYRFAPIKDIAGDRKEVFFAGVHSDIGGSYPEEESGLSKIALEWMLGEASQAGLRLNRARVDRYLYGKDRDDYTAPNHQQAIHNSLSLLFIISDFIPRLRFKENSWPFDLKIDFALWPKRKISPNALVHSSVFDKIKDTSTKPLYKPANMDLNAGYVMVKNQDIVYWP